MKIKRSEVVTVRVDERVKEILERLANEGYRTVSQQAEMAIVEWLESKGLLPKDYKKKAKS